MNENTSITQKYGFKVKYNQFGSNVDEYYFDETEVFLIEKFEEIVLELKEKKLENYSMIELGSNQAYYSLLFKSILIDEKVMSIMVEPYEPYFGRGVEHFKMNNYSGIFINKSIGDKWVAANSTFEGDTTTVDKLIQEYGLENLDILHSDIDGSELTMLEGCEFSLSNKKINYLVILTHGVNAHIECLNFISKYDYKILIDYREPNVGGDSLIILKVNK